MSEQRYSEIFIWICITVLGLSVIAAQMVTAGRNPPGEELRITYPFLPAPPPASAEETTPAESHSSEATTASTVDLFIEAIVQVESAGDPDCVGMAGERGLMQLKRGSWHEAAARVFAEPPPFEQAFDPELNRRVGQAYLAGLQEFLLANRSGWNADMRSLLAACYNAGPGRVQAAGFSLHRLPAPTRSYVERVTTLHDYYLATPSDQLYANRLVSRDGS